MRLPETVRDILNKLETAGFQAYAVGGCVRDSILGKEPDDWDLTTDARPEEVKALFPRTVDTGLQHGTVTVLLGGEGYEVTTYRIDGSYSDGRHPDSICFTPSLAEDLKRRDFTINAENLWISSADRKTSRAAVFAASGIRMRAFGRMRFACSARCVLRRS